MVFAKNVCNDDIDDKFKYGSPGSETRSLAKI